MDIGRTEFCPARSLSLVMSTDVVGLLRRSKTTPGAAVAPDREPPPSRADIQRPSRPSWISMLV